MNLKNLFSMLVTLTLIPMCTGAYAEEFKSSSNRYSVGYVAPWKPISLPDPSSELFLLCDEKVCGSKVLLSFGAYLEPALKSGKLNDLIIQNVRSNSGVAKAVILREGRTKLGIRDAYEVVAELTLQSGQKRIRHTFMTFNAGYVYNVSLGCPPELHERAVKNAQQVLATYRVF
jgi:hypothetical protein